jgi:nucleoside-diphosphate-sugar epimerase
MRSLVTGATGFIGSVLTRELLKCGHTVRVLALPWEDTQGLEKLGVEIKRGDLSQPQTIQGICNGVDTVFHLAGRVTDWGTKDLFYTAIYDATSHILKESIGKASRFVYISSIAAIGFARHLKGFKESDTAIKCGLPYGDAKLDAEGLVTACHERGEIECTTIRPANVTGPGSVWVRDIVERMLSMPVPLFDGGRYSASLIYVDNLVDGIVLAGTKDIAKGKTYQLRDDWDVTWKRYVTDLGAFIGKKPSISIPYRTARSAAWVCDMVCTPLHIRPPITRMSVDIMGRDMDVDNTLAKLELGWKTRVSYPEAMLKIGPWVKEHYGPGN